MTAYFSEDMLEQLEDERVEIQRKYGDLLPRFVYRTYKSVRARENAVHGFSRRLSTLARAIDLVFTALPPDRDTNDIPNRDQVLDAAIAIQSSVFNTFGCLDNLAWIWVSEAGVKRKDGKDLDKKEIALHNKLVRSSFSTDFRTYLDSRQVWFDQMKELRDALAHRIPLYIPPYSVTPGLVDEYNRLKDASREAFQRVDLDEYDKLQLEQQNLGRFTPLVNYSPDGKAAIVFHAQLLANYNTVVEFGRMMLAELDRHLSGSVSATD